MKLTKSKIVLVLITLLLLIILFVISLLFGSKNIDIFDILRILWSKIFNLQTNIDKSLVSIVWDLRMPRIILSIMIGGGLSVSGVCLQSILRNPIASPFTLGVASGSSLFVGFIIIFKIYILGQFSVPVFGFLGSLFITFLVILFSDKIDKNFSSDTIILVGIIIGMFINSILILITAISHTEISKIVMWQMGSLSLKDWSHVAILFPFLFLGIIIVIMFHRELDIISLGDIKAKSMGVNTRKVKLSIIIATSIIIGGAVSIAGIIGFVGLIIPHIVRKIFGYKHANTIPFSFIYGGIFLMFADLISKNIMYPSELPIGAITSCIGAPFFIFIFFFNKNNK